MKRTVIALLISTLLVGALGCASMNKTEKGAVVGATAGAILGAVIGGLTIGVAEVGAGVYLSRFSFLGAGFSGIVPWLLMMVVLVVRPFGLFGTEEIRRV